MSGHDSDIDALRDSVRKVLRAELPGARLRRLTDEGAAFDHALWRKAAELGWPALAVSESHGGIGLGPVSIGALFEELGAALAPLPYLGTILAARALELGGSAQQQARWLPVIAAGEATCAVSEPAANGATPLPVLTRGDGGVILDGVAGDLLQGAEASLLAILARETSGEVFVVVEPAQDGVTPVLERTVDRTRHLARLELNNLGLPVERVLVAAPAGQIRNALQTEAELALASESAGGAAEIFARTIDYLKIREQFGRPIGSFQALKHRCADHKVALTASAAVVREAVVLHAAKAPEAPAMAALAKAYACEVFAKVAEDAVQLHGGIGFTWEQDCHLFLKRAKLNQALFGTTAATLDRAAELLLAGR